MGLHPDFPVVQGVYRLTDDWQLTLAEPHNRRFEEDGSLVLWRPGFTIWLNVWNNDHRESVTERLSSLKNVISKEAFDLEEVVTATLARLTYRLDEPRPEGLVHAYYGLIIGPAGHVQIAIYFDSDQQVSAAKNVLSSVKIASP